MTDYQLGRRPPKNAPALMASSILKPEAPEHPLAADFMTGVEFGLDGNDRYGVCIAPDARVLTADLRWRAAATIEAGDQLLGFDEETLGAFRGRRYGESTVEASRIITRPCYELEFDDGTTIVCSAEHRWLTRSTTQGELGCQRWTETKHLKVGPVRQTRVVKSFDVWDEDRSYEAGYLAGAFDGEGNLEMTRHGAYSNRICFVQRDNEMLERVLAYLEAGGYAHSMGAKAVGARTRTNGSLRDPVSRVTVNGRSNWLRLMGAVRPARLLPKVELDRLGRINGDVVRLVRKDFVGERYVVALTTSSRTYFAEGLASHNCGPTSCDNYCRAVSAILAGKSLPWTQDEVFALYKLNNPDFDPNTGAGDQGVDMQTMLKLWHKHGAGHDENGDPIKPVAFAKVDPKDDGELDAAASVCGGILWGATLQVAQQAQSDADPPEWDYQDSGPWGGHAVYHGGYVEATRLDHVVSWAKDVAVTARFRYEQLEEAWMVILPWHVKHPEFHEAIDLDALAATYKALTGRDLPIGRGK